jgi:N-methylhydantoinase A
MLANGEVPRPICPWGVLQPRKTTVPVRLGVDVGGTFSDLVIYDEDARRVIVAKGLSTAGNPDRGVLDLVSSAVSTGKLSEARFFLHGTTVGLNAVLERRGSVVAVLATAGFRDVLEIRRGDRLAAYDPTWRPKEPLVSRRLRLPITERVAADGTELTPLKVSDVQAAAEVLAELGVESVAISFINSYANPRHELLARDALVEAGFAGDISLSHEVSGEFREYERTSTTVIDAYVRPRVSHYLSRLEQGLAGRGFGGTGLITRCGGGALTFAEAELRPFETVMSGPVAGVVGAAELCRRLDVDTAITADVGGTSFDTCLIEDGHPTLKHEGEIDDMPVQTPWVDVRSIGAGGGSIIRSDGGLLRVGPQSAGANPGPACYGAGGTRPTVTDAAVALGILPAGRIAGGISLDVDAAERALSSVGDEVGLSAFDTAIGAIRIVASTMADAIRSVSLGRGHDPRLATLIAYGGAGPLFATMLAEELDIDRVLIPRHPGNFSAWGLLNQDLTQSAATTAVQPLDQRGLANAEDTIGDLFTSLRARSDARLDSLPVVDEASIDLRYTGQEYCLNIPLEIDHSHRITDDADALRDRFTESYERTFGHSLTDDIQIVTLRATQRRMLPEMAEVADSDEPAGDCSPVESPGYSFTEARRRPVFARERKTLTAGEDLSGPLIITEPTATTYLDSGWRAAAMGDGTLLVERQGGRG